MEETLIDEAKVEKKNRKWNSGAQGIRDGFRSTKP